MIATALVEIHPTPGGWVIVESIRRAKPGLVLSLAVRKGKVGPRVSRWDVCCAGVREVHISDLNGGGIRLYVRLSASKSTRPSRTRPRVLHLGNSFVVADRFEVRRRLANDEMRTSQG